MDDDASRLALSGELTIYRAAELRELLLARVGAGATRLDLSGVTEIDSAGYQLLVAARRSALAAGRTLVFEHPAPVVGQLAATFGLDAALLPQRPAGEDR